MVQVKKNKWKNQITLLPPYTSLRSPREQVSEPPHQQHGQGPRVSPPPARWLAMLFHLAHYTYGGNSFN